MTADTRRGCPGDGPARFLNALAVRGAVVTTVLPYRYASQTETNVVANLIAEMEAGAYDMIVFTSSPQVDRLVDVARERQMETALKRGLSRVHVAVVGPVVENALKALGITPLVDPPENPHLKPLIKTLSAALEASRRHR